MTLVNRTPLIIPPIIAFLTLDLKFDVDCIKSFAASLFNGSLAFGSMNRNSKPKITLVTVCTGLQSSRKTFKQMFPFVSKFGWYTIWSHYTFGGSCGYESGILNVNVNLPPCQ